MNEYRHYCIMKFTETFEKKKKIVAILLVGLAALVEIYLAAYL